MNYKIHKKRKMENGDEQYLIETNMSITPYKNHPNINETQQNMETRYFILNGTYNTPDSEWKVDVLPANEKFEMIGNEPVAGGIGISYDQAIRYLIEVSLFQTYK